MKAIRILVATIALAIVITSSLVAADPPGREFTGTAVVNTTEGTRSMPLTLVVNRFASADEVQQLADVLATGGQSALLGAIRYRNDGQINLGADVRPISLVFAEETRDGHRIVFLTARRIDISEKQLGRESLEYPFGIAEIVIDGFSGKGDGNLHVELRRLASTRAATSRSSTTTGRTATSGIFGESADHPV